MISGIDITTPITIGKRIEADYNKVQTVDMSNVPSDEGSQSAGQGYDQTYYELRLKMLESDHTVHPDRSATPSRHNYATITVNGEEIAEVWNSGAVLVHDKYGEEIRRLLDNNIRPTHGPVEAQFRAEIIADLIGGKVEKSATALTQNQYEEALKNEPQGYVDQKAMRNDPRYEEFLLGLEQAKTAFLAQQIGQSDSTTDI